MADTSEPLVTTGEAARALGIAPTTLARWAGSGLVTPALRTRGGHYRWNLTALREQLQDDERQGTTP